MEVEVPQVEEHLEVESQDPEPAFGSLAERAKAAREEASKHRTIVIDVSTYEGVLAMEYRLISWQKVAQIRKLHERQRDEGIKELYIACDQLLTACEQAHEVQPDGTLRPLGVGWGAQLCQMLGIEGSAELTPRQAMIKIFEIDSRIIGHWAEYLQWQQGEIKEVDREVGSDFTKTA